MDKNKDERRRRRRRRRRRNERREEKSGQRLAVTGWKTNGRKKKIGKRKDVEKYIVCTGCGCGLSLDFVWCGSHHVCVSVRICVLVVGSFFCEGVHFIARLHVFIRNFIKEGKNRIYIYLYI